MLLIALLLGMVPQDNNPPPRKSAKLDPNKMICRTQEVTGSLVGAKKVCRTRAEWAAEESYAKETIDRLNPHVSTCTTPGGC